MNKKRVFAIFILLALCTVFASAQVIRYVSANGQYLFITHYADGYATAVQNGISVTFNGIEIFDDGTAAFYNPQFGYLFVTVGMAKVCYVNLQGVDYWFFLDIYN